MNLKKCVFLGLFGLSIGLNGWLFIERIKSLSNLEACANDASALREGIDDLTHLALIDPLNRSQILQYLKETSDTPQRERLVKDESPDELYAFPIRYQFNQQGKLIKIEGLDH